MTGPSFTEIKEFIHAAWEGDVSRLDAFLDKYPDCVEITRGEPIGWNGLMWAALSGNTDSIEIFLNRGANIEARDLHGQTPLIMAAQRGHFAAVKLLLAKGADVMVTDHDGQNAADCAQAEGKTEIVTLLAEAVAVRIKQQSEAEQAAAEALSRAEKAVQDRMRATARSGKFRIRGPRS